MMQMMMRAGLRRRVVIAAVAALAATGLLAGAAFSTDLDNTTDTAVTIDSDAHWWNNAEPITSGAYQYFAYWGADPSQNHAPLKVTRRQLSNNSLQTFDFSGLYELGDSNDGHNTVHMGISETDGRIHIAWTKHNDPLNYVYSSAGCLSQATFTNCTWTHTGTQADAAHESSKLTYPLFFTKPDGTLFMTYRFGSSEAGDQYLNKYNNNGTWTAVGRIMHGYDQDGSGTNYTDGGSYDPDGAGGVDPSSSRGPYIWGFRFDPTGRLHAMWNWREKKTGTAPGNIFGGTWSQHGAYYAYSDDDGVTWKNDAGSTVATAASDPIKVTDSGLEVKIGGNTSLPYGTHFAGYDMALDSRNQPHAVLPVSDVVTDALVDGNLREKHLWRTTSGTWYSSWVEPSGGNNQVYSIGSLMFDRADDAYFIYHKNNLGWSPYNNAEFGLNDLKTDYVTWQGGDHLHIQQMTDVTAIRNNDRIDTPISTSGNKQVRIRMRNNTDGDVFGLAWTTNADPDWSLSKTQSFPGVITKGDGSTWKDYTFTVTDADWNGTLRDLEINPIEGTTAESDDEIDIDYIRITNSSGTIAKQWEFNKGGEILAAQASPTDNWATWESGTALLPGVSDSVVDDGGPIDVKRYASGTGNSKVVSFATTLQGGPFAEAFTVHDFDLIGDTSLKDWNFDVDTQAWSAANHVSGFGYVSDSGANSVTGTITGGDSQLKSADDLKVKLEAAAHTLHVRMKNGSAATQGAVCFTTDAAQTFTAGKCKTFAITANSGYTDYTVDMSTFAEWTSANTLRRLRIDPADNASSGTFHVSRVYIATS
jgi:hypothetical protein